MVTFTVMQINNALANVMEPINSLLRDSLFIDINDALDRIAQPMGALMRQSLRIDLRNTTDNRQYTMEALRAAGWNSADLIRLMWADERTPWPVRITFVDHKKRHEHEKVFSQCIAPQDGLDVKYAMLADFFECLLDAHNKAQIGEAAE